MSNESKSLRSYYKSDSPSLDVKDVQITPTSQQEEEVKNPQSLTYNGRDYTKPLDGDRDYYLIILIVEDAVKTPKYFKPIIDRNIRGFHLLTISNKERGIPASHMRAKAEECMSAYDLDFESGDELYMLCDLDHYRLQLIDLLANKNEHWSVIISNPCIEVWLYYGKFKERPDKNMSAFQCPTNPKKISKAFKTYLGARTENGLNTQTAIYDIETAIINAESHYKEDENQIPTLYSTSMFRLARRLIEIIRPELDVLKTSVAERRDKYLQKK